MACRSRKRQVSRLHRSRYSLYFWNRKRRKRGRLGLHSSGKKLRFNWAHLQDEYDIAESWTLPGSREDALKVVEGWDKRCRHIIAKTPREQLIDHKLLWRDPLPRWVSDKGRVILIGDSAHTFLPTSIQGAGQ